MPRARTFTLSGQKSPEVGIIASSSNWIEGEAIQQLRKTAALPSVRLAVGLPDLHPGKGHPIGAAFAVEGWLYPGLVGSDIGCGIGLWRTELSAKAIKREAWADGFTISTTRGTAMFRNFFGRGVLSRPRAIDLLARSAAETTLLSCKRSTASPTPANANASE